VLVDFYQQDQRSLKKSLALFLQIAILITQASFSRNIEDRRVVCFVFGVAGCALP
jgi:hypothetical protein